MDIYVEPRVKRELISSSSFFTFVHTWDTGTNLGC